MISNLSKENELINTYITDKVDNNDKALYDDLIHEISYMNTNLRNIVGESHIKNCDALIINIVNALMQMQQISYIYCLS